MYNFLYEKINLDRILWHYGSMHFGCFIQNPVQDNWADVLSELFRIESTVYLKKICFGLVPVPRSAPNFWYRSGFVFRLCFWKCGFSEFKCTVLIKLGRAILDQVCSVHDHAMIPNLSVNCEVQFSVWENQPGSNSVTLWSVSYTHLTLPTTASV